MIDLAFAVEGAQAVSSAASPLLAFKLRITQIRTDDQPLPHIHSVLLRSQIRLEPGRRKYSTDEKSHLFELFGDAHLWGRTVRSMLWMHTTTIVPAFDDQITIDLPIPCSSDIHLATMKYFNALQEGSIPLQFLFSGTIFYSAGDQLLQTEQISWECESSYALPLQAWREMMEMYYPNCTWISMRRDLFNRLHLYKVRHHFPLWEGVFESLLAAQEQEATV